MTDKTKLISDEIKVATTTTTATQFNKCHHVFKTDRPIDDFIRCLSVCGIEIRLNLLGDLLEYRFDNGDWQDWKKSTDATIRYKIQLKCYWQKQKGQSTIEIPWVFNEKTSYDSYHCIGEKPANQYHAGRDYLESLNCEIPSVDEVKNFFSSLHKIDPDDRISGNIKSKREYAYWWWRAVFLGAISRIKKFGAAFPVFPIIVSEQQGSGKSLSLQNLFPKEIQEKLVIDDIKLSDHQNLMMYMQRGVILEVSEFSGSKKADIEAFKSFISSVSPISRDPYARQATLKKFTGIPVGSTNIEQFRGNDPTEDRRTFPLWVSGAVNKDRVGAHIIDSFNKSRDCLWQFFLKEYTDGNRGFMHELPPEINEIRVRLCAQSRSSNPDLSLIVRRLSQLGVLQADYLTLSQFKDMMLSRIENLNLPKIRMPSDQMLAAELKDNGWKKSKKRVGNSFVWDNPKHQN